MSDGSRLSKEARARFRTRLQPYAAGIARLGLTPNMLTLIGFGIAIVAAVAAGLQWWVAAGLISVAGGAFDMFDGAVARATGTASKFGAFMDSTFDRWGEGTVYVGGGGGSGLPRGGAGRRRAGGAVRRTPGHPGPELGRHGQLHARPGRGARLHGRGGHRPAPRAHRHPPRRPRRHP